VRELKDKQYFLNFTSEKSLYEAELKEPVVIGAPLFAH